MNQITSSNKRDNHTGIENALDGSIYKSIEKSNDYLNFYLNTDGAPLIESRNLFTQEELSNGAIIEDISKTTSKRNPLDLDRVKLLKGKKINSQFF